MAGPQGLAMEIGSQTALGTKVKKYKPYVVPLHNSNPSMVYFNKVKAWMKENMAFETKQWEQKFGEKEWWSIVYKEMTDYTFGFEGNQATFLYFKYKGDLDESQKKPSGEIRGKIRYKQADR